MLKLLQETLAALSRLLIMFATGRSLTSAAAGTTDLLRKDFNPAPSLDEFGYTFNAEGQLRSINTNEPFNFEVKPGDKAFNQANYEALGKVLDLYVYDLLGKEGLQRLAVPTDDESGDSTSFIFASPEIAQAEKLLLLIHGSGVVRAGQWSRRLIINHSLESGTQIPYIRQAKERGFGVIVLNSNQNFDVHGKPVRGSETPEKHFKYVWKHFVRPSLARHIAIVAHSYGGAITVDGASKLDDVARRTFAVAFTDSVHSIRHQLKKNQYDILEPWIKKNMTNWVTSSQPVGVVLPGTPFDCPRVSAGTPVHEETSWKAIDAVWKFIDEKLLDASAASSHADVPCCPSSFDGPDVANSSPSRVDASDQSQNEDIGLADSSSDTDIDGSLDERSESCLESPNDCPMEYDQHADL